MSEVDRRIQLRESIHQLVVSAASNRCVTPAAFVSMVVYEYLQARNEVTAVSEVSTTPPVDPTPAKPAPKPKSVPYTPYEPDEDEIAYVKEQFATKEAALVPTKSQLDAQSVVDAWSDDDDDDYT